MEQGVARGGGVGARVRAPARRRLWEELGGRKVKKVGNEALACDFTSALAFERVKKSGVNTRAASTRTSRRAAARKRNRRL